MQGNSSTELSGRAERLSCLVDGELDGAEAAREIAALCSDAEARATWMRLHLAGDALRSSEVGACHSARFCARVSAALADEPTVLAPRPRPTRQIRRFAVPALAIAASVAAISFVAMPLLGPGAGGPATPIAAAPAAPASVAAADPSLRRAAVTVANARALDPYLAAHRELTSSAVALPRATPYLRPAAEQSAGR